MYYTPAQLKEMDDIRLAAIEKRKDTQTQIWRTCNAVSNMLSFMLTSMSRVCDVMPQQQLEHCNAAAHSVRYEKDDRKFRDKIRYMIDNLCKIVPAWQKPDPDLQRAMMFNCFYSVMDKVMLELTSNNNINLNDFSDGTIGNSNQGKDFQHDCFKNEFEPAMRGKTPPYDIWRRINLCACSRFWRAVTIKAARRMAALAAVDEAARLNADSVVKVLDDKMSVIFPAISSHAFMFPVLDKQARRLRVEQEEREARHES